MRMIQIHPTRATQNFSPLFVLTVVESLYIHIVTVRGLDHSIEVITCLHLDR